MRKLFFFVVIVLALLICAAGYYYGQEIPFSEQWPLFEALRNTAAIIFAVVGAWLAIIYPERLKLSFKDGEGNEKGGGNIGLLLTPAVHSTIILVVLLFVGILAPILKQIPPLLSYLSVCRGLSFFLLTVLTLWQIVIVVMTIFPAELVKAVAKREQAIEATHAHYDKLVKHRK